MRDDPDGFTTVLFDGKEYSINTNDGKLNDVFYDVLFRRSKEDLEKTMVPSKRIGFLEP